MEQDIYAFCLFLNSSHTQYLKAFTYEGALKNEFSLFEIGYLNEELFKGSKKYHTDYISFETESQLALGMTLDSVLDIKGDKCVFQNMGGIL